MKKIISVFSVLCLLLCGCGSNDVTSYPLNEKNTKMADSPSNFTVALNGDVFGFPLEYSEFENLGWKIDKEFENDTLDSGKYSIYTVNRRKFSCEIYIANFNKKSKPLTDCTVCGVSVLSDSDTVVELPKGIKIGVSQFDIKSAYGEPDRTENAENFDSAEVYDFGNLKSLKLYYKEKLLVGFDYFNIDKPTDKTVVDETVPKEIKAYKSPGGLTDNLKDMTFYLYGKTFTFPLPLKQLLKNGWVMSQKNCDYVEAHSTKRNAVKLTNTNRTLNFSLYNPADYATIPENCFITSIKSTSAVKLDMCLAGGVRAGGSNYTIETTYNKKDFTEIKKKGKMKYYIYKSKERGSTVIAANLDSGYISYIKFTLD